MGWGCGVSLRSDKEGRLSNFVSFSLRRALLALFPAALINLGHYRFARPLRNRGRGLSG